MGDGAPKRGSFNRIALALLLIALSVWIASETWGEITRMIWLDEQSSHGLVVPLAVFILVSARRSRLETVRLEAHWLGPVMVLLGVVAWAIGYHTDFQSGWHGGALLMAIGCFITTTGLDPIRKFAPAYLALIFLLPTPATIRAPITVPLQEITATITQQTCELLGMGVTQAGRTLRVNGQDVTVAEACSGMRMVFTLFLACFLLVYSLPLREVVRWLVLLSTPAIAIVANVIRLVPTLWAYGRFDAATADRIHTASGWVMVVLSFFAIEGFLNLLHWMGIPIYRKDSASRRSVP